MKYKDTPFGKIPDNWGLVPISEVTELVTDYVANGSFASLAENVTYKDTEDVAVLIRLVDFNNDFKGSFVFIDEHAYEFLGKSKLYGDEIIISNVGNVGTVFRCPHLPYKMSLAPNAIMVKFKESDDFYYFWLRSHAGQHMLHSIVTGSAQPKFNKTNFRDMLVPVPPRDQQDKIVSILQPLEDKIEQNKKINDNLLQQARVLLAEWQIRNEGEYEFVPLSDVAEINPDTYSPKNAWDYINYLDTSSITDGIISEIQCITPSTEKLPSRARRIIAANDVVFSTVRPNQHHFGIITEPLDNMLASTGFAVIRSCHPLVSNELLYLCLTENSFVEKMQQLAEQSTSTFPSIRPSDLDVCEIPCPIDKDLSDVLNTLFRCIASNLRENRSLSSLRDTLLPKLMSGEIDVSDIQL